MKIKRYMRGLRRTAAMLLSVCMLGGGVVPGEITAWATPSDTELPSDDLGNGASDTLGYKWNHARDFAGWGGVSYRYDLKGLRAGQTNYDQATMDITYTNNGFPTYLVMAGPGRQTPPSGGEIQNELSYDPTTLTSANFYMAKLGQRDASGNRITNFNDTPYYNGAVEKIVFGSGDSRVELESRITTTVSSDRQYILVDYYLCHVGGNIANEGNLFWLASPFDLEVNGSLRKDVYKTSRGFYALDTNSKSTVDVITNDPSLGITVPPDTRWVGHYSTRVSEMFTDSIDDSVLNSDNSLAYSWEFRIRPYETIHRRVAFATKEAAYYVSSQHGVDASLASSSLAGTYKQPFRTIEHAINQCNGKNAYIYIQDYDEINQPIELVPSGFVDQTSIVISSSDMDINGNSTVGTDSYIQTLRRSSGYTGELFKQSNAATIQFNNITLDGNGVVDAQPIIRTTTGTLQINDNTKIQNSTGGAIHVSGNSNLFMNGAEKGTVITNNKSEKGAVYFNSTGNFSVLNKVIIENNKKSDGTLANVYLSNGKRILVEGDLRDSRINVTTEQLPVANTGSITAANQEVVIAEADSSYNVVGVPFESNFISDAGSGFEVAVGSWSGNTNKVVIKRNGYTLIKQYELIGGGAVAGAPGISTEYKTSGEHVSIPKDHIDPSNPSAPPKDITSIDGYTLKNIKVEPDNSWSVSVDTGVVNGIMPASDVMVTYQYERVGSSIAFDTKGGLPQPETMVGEVNAPVRGTMPKNIQKAGYTFLGWSATDVQGSPVIPGLPERFPSEPVIYYAMYEADPNVTFDYTVRYTNLNGDIEFKSTTTSGHRVETEITASQKTIPGYLFVDENGYTNPEEYDYIFRTSSSAAQYGGMKSVGKFTGGNFRGTMPGQNASAVFAYKVDRNQTKPFTVKYQTEQGSTVAPAVTANYAAESNISAVPRNEYGYVLKEWKITKGDEASTDDSNLVSAVQGNFDSNGRYTGKMPNQEVEIVYIYEPTDEGYKYQVRYQDTETNDEALKDIISPLISFVPADTSVEAEQKELYGYTITSRTAKPATAGSFDGQGRYAGRMPNEDLSVDYKYIRDFSKWVTITYKNSANVVLSKEGASPDLEENTAGSIYATRVLKTDGGDNGYTLSQIREKRLMPKVTVTDDHYLFAGWFVDTNNNGKVDGNESILPDEYRFSQSTILTAAIKKNPEKWVTVHFAAGEHGSINPGQTTTMEFEIEKTWNDIQASLPARTPEVNYLEEGWYDGSTPMDGSMNLRNGATYTVRFYKDPAIFGTDVAAPDAVGGINETDGKGRITIYGADAGYQYLVTEMDGTIVDIQEGNITGRIYTEGLYPERRYKVYEAVGSNALVGSNISQAGGTVSSETEMLVPAVEKNYRIEFEEEHDGKTALVIEPADTASNYALFDGSGTLVYSWKPASGSVRFGNLDYNAEYVVIARSNGAADVTEAQQYADGSHIITDPGTVLEIENYVVETVHGTVVSVDGTPVGDSRYEESHKGDTVIVEAEAQDSAGENFLYWEVLIGRIPGKGTTIRERNLTFTMPETNVVLAAHYEPGAAVSGLAKVEGESRGEGYEASIDTTAIPQLRQDFTTADDQVLMGTNGADVTYKVVLQKNKVKSGEETLLKQESPYDDHLDAFKDAWALDVELERYVDGRKVVATPSTVASASEIPVYIQLDEDDVDMMDYGLFEVVTGADGSQSLVPVNLEPDEGAPERNGGLFRFDAYIDKRYVFAYSKAYRVYFMNDIIENRYKKYFKVRRNEAVGDSEYHLNWTEIQDDYDNWDTFDALGRLGMENYRSRSTGVEYLNGYWAYSKKKRSSGTAPEFDTTKLIKQETYVYMNYLDDTQDEVDDGRKELEDLINDLINVSDDPFLKQFETEEIKETIREGMGFLEGERQPDGSVIMPPLNDILEWIEKIKEEIREKEEILDDRYNKYNEMQDNGSHGGSGSGGGSGNGGNRPGGGSGSSGAGGGLPFNPVPAKTYEIGTNGDWEMTNADRQEWAFVLNGGSRLKDMWASLKYTYNGVERRGWYRFNESGLVQSGWYLEEGTWYYLNPSHNGWYGEMKTGWHYDEKDGNWYYFDPLTGAMAIGWREIEGKWYYFGQGSGQPTYEYNEATDSWTYCSGEKPYGSMYQNARTPDGHQVGADGALTE